MGGGRNREREEGMGGGRNRGKERQREIKRVRKSERGLAYSNSACTQTIVTH